MCGISGIIQTNGLAVEAGELQRMNAVIRHRGPDGDGFYFDDCIGLAHRRLAILGLGDEGIQPMALDDQYVITFNGEIYNYIEIGKELEAKGYTISYQTDTEVLLKAYDCWGVDCLNRFNGMWSFALYDRVKKLLFCSRDRFGVKPFYYTSRDSRFLFGSEIRQLLELTGDARVNQQVLLDYLFTGLEDHREDCFFSGIKKLPAAHYLLYSIDKQEFEIKKYYDLTEGVKARTEEIQSTAHFRALFSDAVAMRLRSDVKVGTCLSGGLDSSAIAATAAGLYAIPGNEAFSAIHAKSVDKAGDESDYARMVADFSGLNLIITEPSYSDLMQECAEVIRVQEEPFGSPSVLMQYNVMRQARKHGLIVLLDGQGGDETLLGYERYFASYLAEIPLLAKLSAFRQLSLNSKLSLKDLLLYTLYFSFPQIRKQRVKSRFGFVSSRYLNTYDFSILSQLAGSNHNALQIREISRFQLPHLLKYEDKNSMAWSVEARLPFLDYRLVEYALSLGIDWKIRNGWSKFILRDSMKGKLPDEIIWRKNKFGFEAPEDWVKSQSVEFHKVIANSAIIQKLTGNQAVQTDDSTVLWRLFNIAVWEKTFNVRWDS